MAYVLTIRGFSKSDGKEQFYLEPFWWNSQEFTDHPLVKEIDDLGFLDYEARLSPAELRQMHEQFKLPADDDRYQSEFYQQTIRERMADLDWATGDGASQFSHFIAGLYEWSSGM